MNVCFTYYIFDFFVIYILLMLDASLYYKISFTAVTLQISLSGIIGDYLISWKKYDDIQSTVPAPHDLESVDAWEKLTHTLLIKVTIFSWCWWLYQYFLNPKALFKKEKVFVLVVKSKKMLTYRGWIQYQTPVQPTALQQIWVLTCWRVLNDFCDYFCSMSVVSHFPPYT